MGNVVCTIEWTSNITYNKSCKEALGILASRYGIHEVSRADAPSTHNTHSTHSTYTVEIAGGDIWAIGHCDALSLMQEYDRSATHLLNRAGIAGVKSRVVFNMT